MHLAKQLKNLPQKDWFKSFLFKNVSILHNSEGLFKVGECFCFYILFLAQAKRCRNSSILKIHDREKCVIIQKHQSHEGHLETLILESLQWQLLY